MKYYIIRRDNPQLSDSYFRAIGKVSKKEAESKTEVSYGSATLIIYNTKGEYDQAIKEFQDLGFKVKNLDKSQENS